MNFSIYSWKNLAKFVNRLFETIPNLVSHLRQKIAHFANRSFKKGQILCPSRKSREISQPVTPKNREFRQSLAAKINEFRQSVVKKVPNFVSVAENYREIRQSVAKTVNWSLHEFRQSLAAKNCEIRQSLAGKYRETKYLLLQN